MTNYQYKLTDPRDPAQDSEANIRHDLKYGWSVKCPRIYSNISRNVEYQTAVPYSMIEDCKTPEQAHQRLWDWHNRDKEPVLQIVTKENESTPPLFQTT